MEEIFEQWEELKNRGEISETELEEIKDLELKIKENALRKIPVADLVKTLIDKMDDQIERRENSKTIDKLVYIKESEQEEIVKIVNRIIVELNREENQK